MELTEEVKSATKLLNNSTLISDEIFKSLLQDSISAINNKSTSKSSSNSKADVLKEAQFAIISLLIETAKSDISSELLISTLTDLMLSTERAKLISETYESNKTDIIISLLTSSNTNISHIVDANWKLVYVLKNNITNENELMYRIQLISSSKKYYFNCNMEQLQDLIFKLKDILNHCEKIASLKNI